VFFSGRTAGELRGDGLLRVVDFVGLQEEKTLCYSTKPL
jgi:hypothetical protein